MNALLLLAAAVCAASPMNRLSQEKSPYLAQHAGNPVDWFPWGEEAFAKARSENKPVFLSIGYATCHWCHVMERESFADPKTAEILNRYYVSVKVDREERPDIDKVYMTAATGAGWGGGWPLSIWMTPEGKPFFGGTYFPPEPRWGQPGFAPLLERIGRMWLDHGEDMAKDAEKVAQVLRSSAPVAGREAKPDLAWLDGGFQALSEAYDEAQGGFGTAPKFPMPAYQAFLLRYWARGGEGRALEMAVRTLEKMAAGGIYDHVGGGFHRYSTDARWHVPHFEKMLYDNAELACNYLEAYQATHNPELARVARETLDYVLREMTSPEGGFYSAQDADSVPPERAGEGGHPRKSEGAFYLWTLEQISGLLDEEAAGAFAFRYGAREEGNVEFDPHGEFGGKNVLFVERSLVETAARFDKTEGETRRILEAARARLLAARAKRPRPFLDDKILASWNGLMISAFAKGAQALEEPRYAAAAAKAAGFLRKRLYDASAKRLHHRWRDGERSPEGIADDYAFLLGGLLDLYEADADPGWLDWAEELADSMRALFYDAGKGGFFMTAEGSGAELLYRVMEDSDGVEPSASSAAALALLRLSQLTDRKDLREDAEKTLERFGAQMREQPRSLMSMLAALDFAGAKPRQVVLTAASSDDPGLGEMLRTVRSRFSPSKVLIVLRSDSDRARIGRRLRAVGAMRPLGGKPTAYVCFNFACEMPVTDLSALARALEEKEVKLR